MKNKKQYSSDIYGFDIETTTFEYEQENYTDTYLSCIVKTNFRLDKSIEDIEYCTPYFMRSWNDINTKLKELNKQAIEDNEYKIIFIHNLAYEFDGLVKNCDFVYDNFDNKKALFIKSRKPCVVTLDHIELRCTYLLTGKSLRTLGEQYNYHKLELDYTKQYFSFSELPKIEYTYNERDVKVMLYCVLKELSKFTYIQTVEDIPYTLTGLTRQLNKVINTDEDNKEFQKRNIFQRFKDIKYIEYLQQIYTGGYTHANIYTVGKILKNVISIDIVSSYPTSMLYRWYPYNFKKCTIDDTMFFFNWILNKNKGTYNDKTNNYNRPFVYSFFATVTLKNVKVKTMNSCTFPVISLSKCLNEVKLCAMDNGRLATGREVQIAINEIDYWIIEQFYDFELIKVENLYYTGSHRPLSNFSINCVLKYADEKSVLKNITKKFEKKRFIIYKKDFYCERTKEYIFSDEEIHAILSLNIDERVNMIYNLLSNAKSKLNAQYGIQVQKLYQENYNYIKENDEFEKNIDYELPRVLYRNFEEGLYITAYSRLTLFTMALKLIDYGVQPIYSDTDSWKILGDINIIKQCVNDYNKQVESIIHCSNFYNIGYFDLECKYDYLCTWGCKKYITVNDNEVHCTIAGVPKKNISKAMTELYKDFDYDFNELCEVAFSPNTVYHNSVTEKLSTKYKTSVFNGVVTDENNKSDYISFHSMVELVDTDYVILDTVHCYLNYNYIKMIELVQHRHIDIDNYKMLIKKGGKIIVEYVTDYNTPELENLDTKDCEV